MKAYLVFWTQSTTPKFSLTNWDFIVVKGKSTNPIGSWRIKEKIMSNIYELLYTIRDEYHLKKRQGDDSIVQEGFIFPWSFKRTWTSKTKKARE